METTASSRTKPPTAGLLTQLKYQYTVHSSRWFRKQWWGHIDIAISQHVQSVFCWYFNKEKIVNKILLGVISISLNKQYQQLVTVQEYNRRCILKAEEHTGAWAAGIQKLPWHHGTGQRWAQPNNSSIWPVHCADFLHKRVSVVFTCNGDVSNRELCVAAFDKDRFCITGLIDDTMSGQGDLVRRHNPSRAYVGSRCKLHEHLANINKTGWEGGVNSTNSLRVWAQWIPRLWDSLLHDCLTTLFHLCYFCHQPLAGPNWQHNWFGSMRAWNVYGSEDCNQHRA